MESKRLESWKEILDMIDKCKEFEASKSKPYQIDPEFIFRGQSDASWPLASTLERSNSPSTSVAFYNRLLYRILFETQTRTSRVWEFESDPEIGSDFFMSPPNYDFMVFARHHGFPSPLLDWSASPYVALYFAYRNARESEDVALFTFLERPEGMKVGWIGAPQINQQGPYTTSDERHFQQQAQYTVCVEKQDSEWRYCSHQDYFDVAADHQDYLRKYVLPGKMKIEVLRKLQTMNVNAYSLFGTIDGLMDSLAVKVSLL